MVECFVEVCMRRGLKVNAGKSKVMVLKGEKGLKCEFCVDGMRLEHVSEFKQGVFRTNQGHMRQSVRGRWRVGGGLKVVLSQCWEFAA